MQVDGVSEPHNSGAHPEPRGTHQLPQALPGLTLLSLQSPELAPSPTAQRMGIVQLCTCCCTAWWVLLKCVIPRWVHDGVGCASCGSDVSDDDDGDGDDDHNVSGGVVPRLEDAQGGEDVVDVSAFAPEPGGGDVEDTSTFAPKPGSEDVEDASTSAPDPGSEDEEDASTFAPKPGSEAEMQVGNEASFTDDILFQCDKLLLPLSWIPPWQPTNAVASLPGYPELTKKLSAAQYSSKIEKHGLIFRNVWPLFKLQPLRTQAGMPVLSQQMQPARMACISFCARAHQRVYVSTQATSCLILCTSSSHT
eukprot:924742-Pelagomonas_calceolata.AAC.2